MQTMTRTYPAKIPGNKPPTLDVRNHALFLDLDGTLLDIREKPDAVHASAELRDLLHDAEAALSGALAIITGRTIADAARILHGGPNYIAGIHGFEIRRGASLVRDGADIERLNAARADVRAQFQQQSIPAVIEDKQASLALHFRHIPEAADAVRAIAHQLGAAHDLRVLEGKMVVELNASARTKGYALAAFMAAPPFAGRTPIAVGDDHTDEDAFVAAVKLGGAGVLVGTPRESRAAFTLPDPAEVIAWLKAGLGV